MTVTLSSSLRIGLVAGTGVSLSGPVVPAITTDDIFNPNAPTQTLTQMLQGISSAQLLGSAIVNGTVLGTTPLFAVPVNQILIPTQIIFTLSAIAGSGAVPVVNVGYTGVFTDFINAKTLTGITVAGKLLQVTDFASAGLNYTVVPSGNELTIKVTTAATYSTYTLIVYVFGFMT
jgi:hypothetical protein